MIIVIVALVIFFGLIIFCRDFRTWLGNTLQAIVLLIANAIPAVAVWLVDVLRVVGRIVGIYSIVLGATALFALILIVVALLINAPGFTAFAFVLAISLVLLAWLPAGIILKVFRINKNVVPLAMKTFIAWVAFVGFLGLVMPDVLTFKSIMGAALVAFILLGVTTKIKALDVIIFPLVIIMCLSVAWKHFFPEDFRSTTRFIASWGKVVNTAKDRSSIDNETGAATTYGVVLRDVTTLYDFTTNKKTGTEIPSFEKISLSKGTIVKISSHKQEVKEFDGQGFVRIQLANADGSFVLGEKRWIEAEYVMIATPRDLTPEDKSLLPQQTPPVTTQPAPSEPISSVRDSIFTTGEYYINVKGETPYNIVIVPSKIGCAMYSLSSEKYNYQIKFFQGDLIQGSPTASLKYYERPKFQLCSQQGDLVKLTVI